MSNNGRISYMAKINAVVHRVPTVDFVREQTHGARTKNVYFLPNERVKKIHQPPPRHKG